jgi:leucyl/phenylalanyl-tRNA--protein transferase
MFTETDPDVMLAAYRQGIFPMAESAEAPSYNFYRPKMRGQLSINNLHIPTRLLKKVKQFPYKVTINTNFKGVIEGCAATNSKSKKGRTGTWINAPIKEAFLKLHEAGYAHSVECWQNEKLVGGLYGLAIGAVFCGESMFSTATDASKIALVHLCARLQAGGFCVLDTQFTNPHLEQFGITEIPQEEYEALIKTEMEKTADFILCGQSEGQLVQTYLSQ